MAIAERTANVVWTGTLTQGSGVLTLLSGATPELPVTWASRTKRSEGRTSPEELLAAALAACFSMAFSNDLSDAGTPPTRLDVEATALLRLEELGVTQAARAPVGRKDYRGRRYGPSQAAAAAASETSPRITLNSSSAVNTVSNDCV